MPVLKTRTADEGGLAGSWMVDRRSCALGGEQLRLSRCDAPVIAVQVGGRWSPLACSLLCVRVVRNRPCLHVKKVDGTLARPANQKEPGLISTAFDLGEPQSILANPQQHHHTRLRSPSSSVTTFTMAGVSQLTTSWGSEPVLTAPSAVRQHRLQASLPLPRPPDRTLLTVDCSAVIRSNITLLGTVFTAAFGMQLYVATPAGEAAREYEY